jgi:predicted metal-dependent peptidase
MYSEELGEIIVAVDCSGSVGERELALFGSELNGILSAYDCTAVVIYHDSEVQKIVEHSSTEGELKLEPVGGGGTSHVCVWEWMNREGRSPACVVCLTDMESEFPSPADVTVPVLWASVGGANVVPPFGRVVQIEARG